MMEMLLTGEPIKANYAKEIGLINDHFSKSKLNDEVLKVALTKPLKRVEWVEVDQLSKKEKLKKELSTH